MSETRYFQLTALLPIAIPLLVLGLLKVAGSMAQSLPDFAFSLFFLLVNSFWIGALPYAVVAAPILWWLRRKPAKAYHVVGWCAPVLFATIFLAGQFGVRLYFGGSGPIERDFFVLPKFCLILGYGYVVIVFLGLLGLRSVGAVRSRRAAA
jgi:hypothetical protein